jgi:hypothetical protein
MTKKKEKNASLLAKQPCMLIETVKYRKWNANYVHVIIKKKGKKCNVLIKIPFSLDKKIQVHAYIEYIKLKTHVRLLLIDKYLFWIIE